MKKTIKPNQLKLSKLVVRRLSLQALDDLRGGADKRYTSACVQTNHCPTTH